MNQATTAKSAQIHRLLKNIQTREQKRRFAVQWVDAVVHEDLDLPEDEEIRELVDEELQRRWDALAGKGCKPRTTADSASVIRS